MLLAIAALTLTPRPGTESISALCLVCGARGAADAALNLLLFAPLGWLAGAARSRRFPRGGAGAPLVWAGAVGALVSLAVEVVQMPIPGRDASLGDLVFNTLGAGVGAGAWILLGRPHEPSRALARVVAASLAGAAAVFVGAWLLGPSVPDTEWWGQWTPDLGHLAEYRGSVLAAGIGALPVAAGRIAEPQPVRAALRRAEPVRILLETGPPPDGVAPIFSIYDAEQREILLVGADGRDGILRFRTRGSARRFEDVPIRFPDAFEAVSPGDTVRVALVAEAAPRSWGDGACLTVGGRPAACSRWSPAAAWNLLLPLGGAAGRALELLWLALLFAPAGVLAARAGGRAPFAAGGLAVAAVALVPAVTPVGRAHPAEAVVVAAAASLPWLLARARGPLRVSRTPRAGA